MEGSRGYRIERLTRERRAMAAGQEIARKRHLMYGLVEADLTLPRALLREHREHTGERLSFTAYVVSCVARALAEFPELNALRRGRDLILIDEIIVEVLIERTVNGQSAVSYLPIRNANAKSFTEIHAEIRAAQNSTPEAIAGQRWLAAIPPVLIPPLMRWMRQSIPWALRLGVAGVNNVGMGSGIAGWAVSPGAGTLAVTIGGISRQPRVIDGRMEEREIGHLTIAVDHDVVDGAPAARFTSRLLELLAQGEAVRTFAGPRA
ncbi:2-oxo acid dehydrogenase subunit E2 [Sinomonas humi]|uniref:2-oxo acid dehydrogenase subunit E2 n=1 Tax=Sinomonas humi TaxID=1338436 RepID=UPI00068C7FFF|nr:2-oxo acid dehydrogenase subunit E2 [Sinomonas humi]